MLRTGAAPGRTQLESVWLSGRSTFTHSVGIALLRDDYSCARLAAVPLNDPPYVIIINTLIPEIFGESLMSALLARASFRYYGSPWVPGSTHSLPFIVTQIPKRSRTDIY